MKNVNNENAMVRVMDSVEAKKIEEMEKYSRLNELTNVVERYLEYNSDKEGRFVLVDKHLFLETLIDAREVPSKEITQGFEFEYHFLNRRISMKFEQTFIEVADLIDRDEFFQQVSMRLVEYVNDLDSDFVKIDKFGKNDDVGYMVLIIDKECKRSVLEQNGIKYDRSEGRYINYMDSAIYLDEHTEEENVDSTRIGYFVADEDVIKQVSNSDEDWDEVGVLMDSMRLTDRQKEVLSTYMYCGENMSETGRELGVRKESVRDVLKAVERRAEKYFGIEQEVVNIQTPMLELRDLLDSEDFDEDKLIEFLANNIKDVNIEELIYSTDDEKRRTFIRILNGKTVFESEKRVFATEFLSKYYDKY